ADYQGTLERFSGDAMMVFLNDPIPVQNHAEQGARMAVAMRNRLEALRIQWSKRGYELGAGIGIATGYATLGLVGFERRTDYAAIGTVTNLAARLCGDRKSTRLNSSHVSISYAVFCLKKKTLYYMNHLPATIRGFTYPTRIRC